MPSSKHATIWQGYRHAWQYNHRVNRFGSYVEDGDSAIATVTHTAASGTGGDYADFIDYVTPIAAEGVAFQSGVGETVVECQRTEDMPFHIKIDNLDLHPDLVGRDRYTVIINGFGPDCCRAFGQADLV